MAQRIIIGDVRGQRCRHPSSSLSPSFPFLQRNKTPSKPNQGTIVPVPQRPILSGSKQVSHPLAPAQWERLTHPARPLVPLPLALCLVCLIGAVSCIQAASLGAFSHALPALLWSLAPPVSCAWGLSHTNTILSNPMRAKPREVRRADAGGSVWRAWTVLRD